LAQLHREPCVNVAVNGDGLPSFNLLENLGGAEHTILLNAFDLLILAGTDLRSRPLEHRGRYCAN